MANDVIKGVIKVATAIVAVAFGTKVGSEGAKNINTGMQKTPKLNKK